MAEHVTQARDIFRNALLGSIQSAAYVNNADLAAGVAQHFTIPTGYNMVVFGVAGGADVYCNIKATNTDIAIPGANITNGSSPELISSSARAIRHTDAYICLISPSNCNVTMAFFASEVRA